MKSLRWSTRLILLVIGVVLLAGIVSGALALQNTNALFENYLSKTWQDQAVRTSEVVALYYQEKGSLEGISDIMSLPRGAGGAGLHRGQGSIAMRVMGGVGSIITDPSGRIIWQENSEEYSEDIELEEQALKQSVSSGGKVIAYIVPVNTGLYEPAKTLEGQYLNSVLLSLLWGTAISVLIALVLGLLLSKSLLKPLRKLIKAAREFSGGNLEYRLENKVAGDIEEVYTAFNEMAEKLAWQEKLRRDSMADIAHELRTPLTILSGNLESMQEGIEEINPAAITSLHDEVLRMRGLVDDLQQLTLAEAKQLTLNKKDTDLAEFIKETIALFDAEVKEKEVVISLEQQKELPHLNIDRARMRQVLINLLSNALRYVPVGGKIRVDLESGKNELLISIHDNGPGIAAEDLPYVFERFYRGDKARTRQSGGTGLGLAIVKSFVEAHEGRITVKSSVLEGTAFCIELPIR